MVDQAIQSKETKWQQEVGWPHSTDDVG